MRPRFPPPLPVATQRRRGGVGVGLFLKLNLKAAWRSAQQHGTGRKGSSAAPGQQEGKRPPGPSRGGRRAEPPPPSSREPAPGEGTTPSHHPRSSRRGTSRIHWWMKAELMVPSPLVLLGALVDGAGANRGKGTRGTAWAALHTGTGSAPQEGGG